MLLVVNICYSEISTLLLTPKMKVAKKTTRLILYRGDILFLTTIKSEPVLKPEKVEILRADFRICSLFEAEESLNWTSAQCHYATNC